jgi:Spy/CpxP family protein refolding chaperone
MKSPTKILLAVLCLAISAIAPTTQAAEESTTAPAPAPAPAKKEQREKKGGKAANPEHQLKGMTERLGLSADQQKQILPILQDEQKAIQDLRSDASVDPKAARTKMHELTKTYQDKIKAVLTPEQAEKFSQARANQKGDKPGKGGDKGAKKEKPQQ